MFNRVAHLFQGDPRPPAEAEPREPHNYAPARPIDPADPLVHQAEFAVKLYLDARRNLRTLRVKLAGDGPVADQRLEIAETLAGLAYADAEQAVVAAIMTLHDHEDNPEEIVQFYGAFVSPIVDGPEAVSFDHGGYRFEIVGLPLRIKVTRIDPA